jgi:hypothetical protein
VKLFKSIFGDVFLMWLWVYCEQAIVGLKIITYKNKKKMQSPMESLMELPFHQQFHQDLQIFHSRTCCKTYRMVATY